jgi:menaquinone-9 beta-reductase
VGDDSVALIGDASGSVDAVTGEGLALSFRQALALSQAIASGSLANYEREHERIGRLPHAMGALMLTMDRWPGLESRAMRVLSSRPELFSELLAAHVGAISLTGFAFRRGPQLGWGLLSAGARA